MLPRRGVKVREAKNRQTGDLNILQDNTAKQLHDYIPFFE